MSLPLPFLKELPDGETVVAVRSGAEANPVSVATALGLPVPEGLLMLSGGAGEMTPEMVHRVSAVFTALGKFLAQAHTTVIDGGTQSGVVALIGSSLAKAKRTAPYIGVLPAYAEVEPGVRGETILEPNHSHFVLVEGNKWGDEVKLMYGLASYLSAQAPSLALLVNGGGISLKEVEYNVLQQREIIVLAGSGRLADEIAMAIRHPDRAMREPISLIVTHGRLTVFDLSDPVADLILLLKSRLASKTRS